MALRYVRFVPWLYYSKLERIQKHEPHRFFNYSKEDFERIWTRRSQLPKTWKGGDPEPAFN